MYRRYSFLPHSSYIHLLIIVASLALTIEVDARECRKYRKQPHARDKTPKEMEPIEKLKNPYSYPYFQLDVF